MFRLYNEKSISTNLKTLNFQLNEYIESLNLMRSYMLREKKPSDLSHLNYTATARAYKRTLQDDNRFQWTCNNINSQITKLREEIVMCERWLMFSE